MIALHDASISQTLELLSARKISPVELIESQLARIATLQPSLNPFVHLDAEAALHAARFASQSISRGESLGPLQGIPLTIKSCIEVAGWPVPAGSLLRASEIPLLSAPVAERLRRAGAILIGSTNTPEFLMAYETDNRVSGRTSNPWNPAYSSGGSSGGEAAAIASGCSLGGVGSDGGGSIRVPAHFCGICGIKPTPGRIPGTGHFPPGNSALGWIGVVGPMARTVSDLRILFNILAGPDSDDAYSVPVTLQQISAEKLAGIRVGILDPSSVGPATAESVSAVARAAKLLDQQGFRVEPFKMHSLDRALELWWFFFGNTIGQLLQTQVSGKESKLSPIFLDYLEAAQTDAPVPMETFVAKSAARDFERARILRAMQDVPVLLAPVSAAPAFRHGEGHWCNRALGGAKQPAPGYRVTMRHAQWLNLAGLPGLTVPISISSEGLPIGIQLVGRPFEEELLISVAESLEKFRGPWQPPSIP
jgi:Asp-tRNA(Asn)/Glu-tRNA(Gln) amidotransferase A subunit family amidase